MIDIVEKELLRRVVGFDEWHLHSIAMRYYAKPLINRINALIEKNEISEGRIVEVGCGLGDILQEVKWKDKIGYDLDSKVIVAARIMHPFLRFRVGTFDSILNNKISVLIALNFLHSMDYKAARDRLLSLLDNNDIEMIIVDSIEVISSVSTSEYKYRHDYFEIFTNIGYKLEHMSKGYPSSGMTRRRILYFTKG